MASKAHMSTGWKVRVGAMAFLVTGMSVWFLVDGFVGYPAQQKIYEEYETFQKKHQGMEQIVYIESWNKYATERGLPVITRDPKELDHYKKQDSILTQKLLGFGTLPLAIIVNLMFFGLFKKWIASEEDGIHTQAGPIAWNEIVKLDKTRWPKKGIAFLHYTQGDKPGRLRIDDFWYTREPTDQIVRDIEAKLTDDQIVGDIRETERDKRRAEKKAAEEKAASKEDTSATTAADAQ